MPFNKETLPLRYYQQDTGVGSEESQKPESSYRPSILAIDPWEIKATTLRDAARIENLQIGTIDIVTRWQKALEMIRNRESPYDIIIFMSAQTAQMGISFNLSAQALKRNAPSSFLALVTEGRLGSKTVPSEEKLRKLGIGYIRSFADDPPLQRDAVTDFAEILNELKAASWLQKQQGLSNG
ncbi:MAG: hypothetical protein A3F31_03550 [Candidatus Levybacteria bacterium RIFCSPHIGHO2_12_FULL_38_12]|nr:MAG: hypothetical protein A2770_00105 [Candidatus Levybacteria bacterium RIFCSPHIGHO2_01_FULL_38_12]OGH22364.1 MAG: hypothetical protein A3D75_01755 [Candidatus Levybacteria bacterium RIFCSPHIGHO2_02_FULL_37_18]OGH23108.1 MAG: hypothetical protein A3F31_03550 [Candidatus Levybacteria bacterium RIFCSPHIGHO2_12_FULL_38_12]OGH34562.1 MAG: hypothetical protein A3A47_00065 [Candidatus Levybacteria bacterium RIFCSPLOWO2_01_FULL_37_20]OGH43678.1 MAG: hypothetical protein A3J14_03720 [Candidatus Lev